MFATVDADLLDDLAAASTWLRVPAGTRLFSVGDAPDGMYGLVEGQVRFFTEHDGHAVLTAQAERGITFGEGSLLIGGGRSRTAVVTKDAELVRIDPEHFLQLMGRSPAVATSVAGSVAARFAHRSDSAPDRPPASVTVDVEPADRVSGAFVERLRDMAGDLPLVEAHGRAGADIERQSDLVLIVRRAGTPCGLDAVRQWYAAVDPLAAPPIELVLVHPASSPMPIGTLAWLRAFPFSDHHHARAGHDADVERVLRSVCGRAIALVLGGGGARGMAHVGVLRALAERGIAVDRFGGSSIGAIIGGQAATGMSWREILDVSRRVWTRRALRLDVTIPTVSVSSGRRVRRTIEGLFGDMTIEDMWRPFFCTTVNLSRFRLEVHRRGPAATWIRASASAPGLWPPVIDASGELHVDGGQLNNVPTDLMRLGHRGRIIAVDVCADQRPMRVASGSSPPIGIRHVLRRRSRDRFPSLVDTINRCALLGSLQHRAQAAEEADMYLTPDLGSISFGAFGRMEEAVEIGYHATIEGLRGQGTSGVGSVR